MRAVVVYESMYGNTHEVAERIAEGLRSRHEVTCADVGAVDAVAVAAADFVVVGGPTHAHGLSTKASRRQAIEKGAIGQIHDSASGPGLREWLDQLPDGHIHAAVAFDTRIDAPTFLTGQASKTIAKRLAKHGYRIVAEPESFLVDRQNRLVVGERDRAVAWGAELADVMVATAHV